MKLFVTAPRNTIVLLEQELRDCGVEKMQVKAAGIGCDVDVETAYRICLWSRVANRVLLPLRKFNAEDTDALYEGAAKIDWPAQFGVDARFAVDVTLTHAVIDHSHYAALRVKDAIVDDFRDKFGERPSIDTENADIRIHVHVRRREVQVALDLSGGSLHRRGYRDEAGAAPLKENLAATLLMYAGWPEQNALFDPLCGSGTLLIEGAMIAADIAPGLLRPSFGFQSWGQHDQACWQNLLDEAQLRREKGLQNMPPIRGQDADRKVVAIAHRNIRNADLQAYIHVETCELADTGNLPAVLTDVEQGLLISNPPYGERIDARGGLGELYANLGKMLRSQLPSWSSAIFTGNTDHTVYQGQVPVKDIPLNNGPIECRLLCYAPIAGQVEDAGAVMFANRLRKNLKKFRKWARREGVDCYRVYDADLPEYALAIDLYHSDDWHVHVQEYKAPSSIDPALANQRLHAAFSVLGDALDIPAERIWFKQRSRQQGKSQYEKLSESKRFFVVHEGPCKLWVNFKDYLDTGLFLDHRITREMVGELSDNKEMLNLYCYTGTATVHAAMRGATSTTSVDMSKTYLDWARRNFVLNNIDENKHQLVRENCLQWLEDAANDTRKRFDVIFLDPPTFSNSKRVEEAFDIQKDHVRLIQMTMRVLNKRGTMIFSNNFRKFKLDEQLKKQYNIEDISAKTIPEDFKRRANIHRCWRIRHR